MQALFDRKVMPLAASGASGISGGGACGLDVRARMLVSVLASVGTVIISSVEGQMLLVGVSLCYALGMRRPVALLWAYAATALMVLMAVGCTAIMSWLLPALMRDVGAGTLLLPFLRLIVMLHVVLPLALGCRIQNLLDALRGLRLPLWLYLPAAVTIRFIPTFVHDIQQVAEALRLRGHTLSVRNVMCRPLRTLRLFGAPLLFRLLRTSEDLGIAAELKGLGVGAVMTPYRQSHWGTRDTLLLLAAVAALAGAFAVQMALGTPVTGGMR